VDEALSRAWHQLLARPTGTFQFRLILQPLVAVIIATRAGTKDARTHRSPFLWRLLSDRAERGFLVRNILKDVGRLFIMAVALDCIYQVIEIRWIYPLQALIVGFVLAIVPYAAVRGPVARIARRNNARRSTEADIHRRALSD
jgi:hypothetical protein